MKIRNYSIEDSEQILALNNANTPAVSELNTKDLNDLYKMALFFWVVEDEVEGIVGFCIILPPGTSYQSLNYLWVRDHYESFQYLDRVAFSSEFQGKGHGRKLYQKWFEQADGLPLLIEVNIKPMNTGSILFHEKMGFSAIGEQDTEGGQKRVQYMLKKM